MATVTEFKNGIEVTFGDGASILVPSDAGSPNLPNWHEYSATYVVNKVGSNFSTNSVWTSLLNGPAPGNFLGNGPATSGSITDTFGPGAVYHIVDYDHRIVVNMTMGASSAFYQHPLYPGAVIRHVYVVDGYVVVESVGIGNFDSLGPLSAAFNNLMGDFFFGGPGPNTLDLMTQPRCFPATTHIATALTSTTPISDLCIGDVVLAFDPYTDHGRGALVPRRVTKLFSNVTTEWVKLSWVEAGVARELVATPGHHFLDQFGNFPPIAEMIRDGGATVVLASGELAEVVATRIVYSQATAHLFEQAQSHIAVAGNTALKPQMLAGWQTYNFEVEDLHTYVADFSNDNFNVQRIAA